MTIDSSTTQRIRSLLEQHGCRVVPTPKPWTSEVRYCMKAGQAEAWDFIKPDGFHDGGVYTSEAEALESGFKRWLNDKAQTGARIAGIGSVTVDALHPDDGGGVDATHDVPGGILVHVETVDEAIAALWLKVHDLLDPRKQVTA